MIIHQSTKIREGANDCQKWHDCMHLELEGLRNTAAIQGAKLSWSVVWASSNSGKRTGRANLGCFYSGPEWPTLALFRKNSAFLYYCNVGILWEGVNGVGDTTEDEEPAPLRFWYSQTGHWRKQQYWNTNMNGDTNTIQIQIQIQIQYKYNGTCPAGLLILLFCSDRTLKQNHRNKN